PAARVRQVLADRQSERNRAERLLRAVAQRERRKACYEGGVFLRHVSDNGPQTARAGVAFGVVFGQGAQEPAAIAGNANTRIGGEPSHGAGARNRFPEPSDLVHEPPGHTVASTEDSPLRRGSDSFSRDATSLRDTLEEQIVDPG